MFTVFMGKKTPHVNEPNAVLTHVVQGPAVHKWLLIV